MLFHPNVHVEFLVWVSVGSPKRGLAWSLYKRAALWRTVYGLYATERPLGTIREEKGISYPASSGFSISSRYDVRCWKPRKTPFICSLLVQILMLLCNELNLTDRLSLYHWLRYHSQCQKGSCSIKKRQYTRRACCLLWYVWISNIGMYTFADFPNFCEESDRPLVCLKNVLFLRSQDFGRLTITPFSASRVIA